jgi:hypothetical protein
MSRFQRLPAMAQQLEESIRMLAANVLNHPNGRLVVNSMNKALQ